MHDEEHRGGCLCGQVRYKVKGKPSFSGVCHCRYCQLRTASAFSVPAYFESDNFEIEAGAVKQYEFKSESDNRWDIYFCSNCGTTVYYQLEVYRKWGSFIGIDSGTFDPPTFWFTPSGEVFCRSKAHFIGDLKTARTFDTHITYQPTNAEDDRLKGNN